LIVWLVLLALVAGWFLRLAVARRARASFCAGEGCVTLALRFKGKRGFGWKHGFARQIGTHIEWRAEYKLGSGADLTFDLNDLRVTEHRPVKRGETMLSHLCELVSVLYRGEPMEMGVPREELPRFLDWVGAS
jgi:hypothetical protein